MDPCKGGPDPLAGSSTGADFLLLFGDQTTDQQRDYLQRRHAAKFFKLAPRRGRQTGYRQLPDFLIRYPAAYRSVAARKRADEELPTAAEVAGELGISTSTLWNYITEHDEKFPPRSISEGAN
jgi:hypothetical protein